MSLAPPEKVRKLQEALHAKAKGSPSYRFYTLYDKIGRDDVLAWAYQRCRSNRGAPGVDGQTFEQIESYGRERWLGELAQELRRKTYRPNAVRRVWIPKADGKQRPLGILTIKDRVAQMAAVIALEPIFEADLQEEQYAYRADRSALDAVRRVHRHLTSGHMEVVDADLKGYFDTIPHAELMKSLARRISDGQMLALLKRWLEAPVEEEGEDGRRHRTSRSKDEGRGIPQGAPISPLLANLYMRRFVLSWKALGYERVLDAHIVNYADDFVICCRGTAQKAGRSMRRLMERLKLTVNEEKTRERHLPKETFDFLGYTIGRCYKASTGRPYIGTRPSKKKVQAVCREVSELTAARWTPWDVQAVVARLNRLLTGWANYFCLGPVSKAYEAVDAHARHRLRQWLRRKHGTQSQGCARYPIEHIYQALGLVRLRERTRNLPWAKA